MEIRLAKQPVKYLARVDGPTRDKLLRAIEGLKDLKGDIVCINQDRRLFRLKISHYRIIFCYSGGEIIVVETINTRTNIKYRRYQ